MHNLSSIYANRQDYQAKIQIRPRNNTILDFVKMQISNKKDVFITKEIEKKFGYDLYITSAKFIRGLSNNLKRRFNGEIKITKSLHSFDRFTSKKLYRVTLLFRLKQ